MNAVKMLATLRHLIRQHSPRPAYPRQPIDPASSAINLLTRHLITNLDVQIPLLCIRRQRKARTPQTIDGSRSLIHHQQNPILAIPLLQEWSDLSGALPSADFFLVKAVGQDDGTPRLIRLVFKELGKRFICKAERLSACM